MPDKPQRLKRLAAAQAHVNSKARMQVAELSAALRALDEQEEAAHRATQNSAVAGPFADYHIRFFHRLAGERARLQEQLNAARLDQRNEQLKLEKLEADAGKHARRERERLEQLTLFERVNNGAFRR